MHQNGLTLLGHHAKWRADTKLQSSDPNVRQHESWCRVLQLRMCYDQLDVSNLASAELISRQIQLIEH
eukprot:2321986-Karenia_brevis.AAC.1